MMSFLEDAIIIFQANTYSIAWFTCTLTASGSRRIPLQKAIQTLQEPDCEKNGLEGML